MLHRCLAAYMARDRLISAGRMLTIFGVLARGANTTNVLLAPLIAGVQKTGLDVHDIPLASGSAGVLVLKCLQPTRIAVERANGYHVFVQSHGRSLRAIASAVGRFELVKGHDSFLALCNRGAFSILDARFKFARRLIWFEESHGQVCVWNKEHLGEFWCLLRSVWSLRWLYVCIGRELRDRGLGRMSRACCEGCSGLRTDKVQGKLQVHPWQVACAPLHPRRKSIWSVQVRTKMRCRLPQKKLRGRPGSVAATSESL